MSLFRQFQGRLSDQAKKYSRELEMAGTCLFVAGGIYLSTLLYKPECNPEFFSSKDRNIEAANFCHGYSEIVLKNYVRNGVVGDLAFLIKGKIEPLREGERWGQPYHAEFRPGGQLEGREFFRPECSEFSTLIPESEYARERLFLEPQE